MRDKEPKTHKLTLDGITGFVMSVRKNGQEITVAGFHLWNKDWEIGDFVILTTREWQETRYKIESIDHKSDPDDQYFMEMSFAPRTEDLLLQNSPLFRL